MRSLIAFCAAFFFFGTAAAAEPVSLNSEVFIEREVKKADGTSEVKLEAPKVVLPGDKLAFVLAYKNSGSTPAADLDVTNPIPESVQYVSAEGDAVVSVDGGKSWGVLQSLTIAAPDGKSRPAVAADVTHVRWKFREAVPAGKGGKLTFRASVK